VLEVLKPRFFRSGSDFRHWLQRHHATGSELFVGFYKTTSGRGGVSYQDTLDQALCYGWIDGIRKNVDASSYTIRFTPRTSKSHWSLVNIKRVSELKTLGLMHTAGSDAFERRDERRTINYSYELSAAQLTAVQEKRFRANRKAWEFFVAQAPSYQRVAKFWVTTAKKEETREKRLDVLIADSACGRRMGLVRSQSNNK
jgi:uncharacterized protein YdeI (YjbR/CyaY-like superfamily)